MQDPGSIHSFLGEYGQYLKAISKERISFRLDVSTKEDRHAIQHQIYCDTEWVESMIALKSINDVTLCDTLYDAKFY